jgi:chemotaxis protein MotB
MLSEFDPNTTRQSHHIPDDPWSTATLSRDSSPNAWLISSIDILLLLTTLLVLLLAWQRGSPSHHAEETKAARAIAPVQSPLRHIPATIRDRRVTPPQIPQLDPHTQPAKRWPQGGSSEPEAPSTPPTSVIPNLFAATPSVAAQKEAITSHAPPPTQDNVAPPPQQAAESTLQMVAWELPDNLKGQVEITREAHNIRLEVKDSLLFESASAELKAAVATILANLIEILKRYPGRVAVEGHTDNQPISTTRYPSNWELSAARVSTVARYLIMHGVASDRVQAVRYADTRPCSTNETAIGRARNRRVTLVMYPQQHG